MGLLDKFLKTKQKKDFNIENDDDFLNEIENKDENKFEPDFNIEEDGLSGELKEQKQNLSHMIKNNKKVAIGIGGTIVLGVVGVIAEPIITSMIESNGTMDNSEYEKTSKEVKEMAQSSVKEEEALAKAQDVERKEKIERLKQERENKKNNNLNVEQNNQNINTNNQNVVQNKENNSVIENKIKEETIQQNGISNVNNNLNTKNNLNNVENSSSNVNNTQTNDLNKNQEQNSKVIEAFKNTENKDGMINNKEYVQSNGEIKNSKIEKEMDEGFNKTVKKIEKTDFTHDQKDVMDPFVQEYDGTINSRAMRNELTENMKLMKDYIEFLETKKKFEEAKLVYEKKKQKNIFEEEINKVKDEFLVEVDGMRKSMDELRNINSELTAKLNNNGKSKELEEMKKTNDELEERKLKLNAATMQKIYKIGQNYLLEETDDQGNIKIYKDGNAYKGHIIEQITPEFVKVKDSIGNTLILTISSGEEISGVYTKIEIPTPNKSEVENKDIQSNNKEKAGTKVENYTEVKNKEQEKVVKETTEEVNQIKSRFLN